MKTFKISDIKKGADMWEIGELSDYGDKWRYGNKRIIVFVDEPDRPFNNGDIVGDFTWRRTHAAPLPARQVLNLVKSYLEASGFKPETAFYSRKAGCSMCPCSPGYIVRVDSYSGKSKAMWLTHKDVSKKQLEKKQRQEEAVQYQQEVATAFNVA